MLIRSQQGILVHISWYDTRCVSKSLCRTKIRKQSENKSIDWMKRGVQTRVVTNREFYELQTCWNGVSFVCSGSYQCAGSRGGRELRKNSLIHFLHERVSLGQHQTSQSTQIYRPLKQQASWPLYATIGWLLRHAAFSPERGRRPSAQLTPLLISSSGALLLPYIMSSHHLHTYFSSP